MKAKTILIIIAILALYAAVGIWNDYFNALIYLKDEALKPLQLLLKEVLSVTGSAISDLMGDDYLKNYVNGERMKYVLIIVSTPMITSGYWALSLFLWSCLLMLTMRTKK